MKILAIIGMPGAGKSLLANHMHAKGFPMIRFGAIVVDEVLRRKLPLTSKSERLVREEIRREEGMDAIARAALPQIKSVLADSEILVIDGLYSLSEYKLLRQEFGDDLVLIAVFSSPRVRYQRLASREKRPLSPEEARERDYMEIERIEKAGPIAMADYTLVNDGTKEELLSKLQDTMELILASDEHA